MPLRWIGLTTAAISFRSNPLDLYSGLCCTIRADKLSARKCVLDSRRCGHPGRNSVAIRRRAWVLSLFEMGITMIMNLSEFVILVLFLTVLLFVPLVVIQFIGRRKPVFKPSLRECPNCGAENHKTKEQCYCCGHRFGSPPEGPDAAVIQRVKQADDRKMRRRAASQHRPAVAEKPSPTERTPEE